MYTVYILYSFQHSKMYTGFTSNLIKRFHDHNSLNQSGFTKSFRPWIVLYTEVYASSTEARNREKWLKSGVGRNHIKIHIFNQFIKLW
jgi:putative endonuclease